MLVSGCTVRKVNVEAMKTSEVTVEPVVDGWNKWTTLLADHTVGCCEESLPRLVKVTSA